MNEWACGFDISVWITLVQAEISQQLLNWLPWTFAMTFSIKLHHQVQYSYWIYDQVPSQSRSDKSLCSKLSFFFFSCLSFLILNMQNNEHTQCACQSGMSIIDRHDAQNTHWCTCSACTHTNALLIVFVLRNGHRGTGSIIPNYRWECLAARHLWVTQGK